MLVKLVDTTNKEIAPCIGNVYKYLNYYGCLALEYLDDPGYAIRTSIMLNKEEKDGIITIKTKNSTYVLEKIDDIREKITPKEDK